MDKDTLIARRKQLEAQRNEIVADANFKLGQIAGQLDLIDELLAGPGAATPATEGENEPPVIGE